MALLNKALSLAKRGKVDGIILAQRWTREEVAENRLRRLAAFWKRAGVPILIFTPMPEFTNLSQQIVKYAQPRNARNWFDDNWLEYDEELLSVTEWAVRSFANANSIAVLDSKELFCGSREAHCSAFLKGRPLLLDYAHLSALGARVLGERIAKNEVWQQWIAMVRNRHLTLSHAER